MQLNLFIDLLATLPKSIRVKYYFLCKLQMRKCSVDCDMSYMCCKIFEKKNKKQQWINYLKKQYTLFISYEQTKNAIYRMYLGY